MEQSEAWGQESANRGPKAAGGAARMTPRTKGRRFYIQHPWETFGQGERTRDASGPFTSLYTARSNGG